MCSLLNHCDRVKMASLAQLVNVIAPIFTRPGGEVIRQTIFWPFQMVSQYGRGQALRYFANVPTVNTVHGETRQVQSAAVYNEEKQQIAFFALNTHAHDAADITFVLDEFGEGTLSQHVVLAGHALDAKNTFTEPDKVVPQPRTVTDAQRRQKQVSLPPLSWNMVVIDLQP